MTAAVSRNENQRAAVWTPGMWRGCYVNIWHGVFLCRHGSKNEWAVIWTMGMYMNVWHVTKLFIYEHLTCDEAVIWTSGMWLTKLLYERLACDDAVIWTSGMWCSSVLYERLACDKSVIWKPVMWRSCNMNVWHVTKLLYERLACDETVIWTLGMWRNGYMNAWHGFVLCHGCYKGRWNSATLMNFCPARPFSFAMFAVITENEGTIIWTSGMAFSFLLAIMPVVLFAAVLLFSTESVCCLWYLRCARKQGIRGQSRRRNALYLYSKLPQSRV